MILKNLNKSIEIEIERNFNFFEDFDEIKRSFLEYKQLKIILNEKFEDDIWIVTNEVHEIKIKFNLNMDLIGKSKNEEIKNALKLYCLILFSKVVLRTAYNTINALIKFFQITNCVNNKNFDLFMANFINKNKFKENLVNFIEFLDFYQINDSENYRQAIVKFYNKNNIGIEERYKRTLPSMESMFKFQNAIEEIINYDLDEKKKYFVLLLWWKITTIVPLRVTEFTLIPYNCIENINNKNYITLYRSNLKGNEKYEKKHKLENDYTIYKLPITDEVVSLINLYKNLVEHEYKIMGIKLESRKFLLSRKLHYNNFEYKTEKINFKENKIDINILKNMLNKFYKNILQEKFNYTIKNKKEKILSEYEIEKIDLMDTRHFAFINLILNDIDPVMIKEIAGHKRVDSSYHYFSNIGSYLESRAYNLVRKRKIMNYQYIDKRVDSSLKNISVFLDNKINFKKVDNGKCFYLKEDFKACEDVEGDCTLCDYLEGNKNISNLIKRKIEKNNEEINIILNKIIQIIKMYKNRNDFYSEYSFNIQKINSIAVENQILIEKIFNK